MKSRNVFDLIWNLGRRVVRLTGLVAILACTLSAPAYAVPVTVSFTVVDSFVKTGTSGPFGLAFNPITKTIWYSTGFESNVLREINQNLPGGPDTGALTLTPYGEARAFDSVKGQFVTAGQGFPVPQDIFFNDPFTGGNQSQITVSSLVTPRAFAIDGLDVDHGEIWYSPDAIGAGAGGNVFRLDMTGSLTGPLPNPVLVATAGSIGSSGIESLGFVGVERIDVGADSLLIVGQGFAPVGGGTTSEMLCAFTLSGVQIGGCSLPNAYEDLAFDGQYLYGANFSGNRIDKICLSIDGRSTCTVPEPPTLPLLCLCLAALGLSRRFKVRAWRRSGPQALPAVGCEQTNLPGPNVFTYP